MFHLRKLLSNTLPFLGHLKPAKRFIEPLGSDPQTELNACAAHERRMQPLKFQPAKFVRKADVFRQV